MGGRGMSDQNTSGRNVMRGISLTAASTAIAALLAAPAAAQTLKASHQFPGGKGDARDEMVQIIAREAKAANVGLDVQVYPGASLFKPNEQWNALVNGQLDISSFPLDYASGKVRAFGATLICANLSSCARESIVIPGSDDSRITVERRMVAHGRPVWRH
jgi:hypothetical protein